MNKDYPDFVESCGYGNILGIAGVNCRHTFYPFYPDVMDEPKRQVDYDANELRYEQTQKQRAMERQIRATKQELLNLQGLETEEAKERIAILKKKRNAQEKALLDYCKKHDLKVQNFRTEVAIGR